MEGRVRVLTVSGIKTLFKALLIKTQPWLTKTHSDQQPEETSHRVWLESRAGLREMFSKLAVRGTPALSHHTQKCASDGVNTKAQQ